jgi:hypothetical protein
MTYADYLAHQQAAQARGEVECECDRCMEFFRNFVNECRKQEGKVQ